MRTLPVGLQSLIVQIAAALFAAALLFFLSHAGAVQATPWRFVLIQAGCSALSSRLLHQPVWWPPLHAGFLPAIVLARGAQLPATVYLAAFVLLLLFYWSSFRTRVPLYLSDRRARAALPGLLPTTGRFSFIDLGSGLGGVPLYLESRFPEARLFGTEIAPAPWFISRVRGCLLKSRVGFLRRDYATLDLGDYDAVFVFLSPAAMPTLWQQACAQMRHGSVLISLSFSVGTRAPDQVVALASGQRHALYVWRF